MKKKYLAGVFLAAVLAAGLTSCVEPQKQQNFELSQDYAASDVEEIQVKDSSWDVEVVQSSDEQVHVDAKGYGDKDEVTAAVKDGVLRIVKKENSGNHFLSFSSNRKNVITISVPEALKPDLDVDCSSGDVELDSLAFNTVNIECSSGDSNLDNVSCGNTTLKCSSGDIVLEDSTTDNLEIRTDSGDIDVNDVTYMQLYANATSGNVQVEDAPEVKDTSVKTISGDITLFYAQEPVSLQVSMKVTSGDLVCSLDGLKFSEDSEDTKEGTIGSGQNRLELKADSGDIELR